MNTSRDDHYASIYPMDFISPIQEQMLEYENYMNYKKRNLENVLYLEHFSSIRN